MMIYLVFSFLWWMACIFPSKQQGMPSSGLSVKGLRNMATKTNYRVLLNEFFPGGLPRARPATPWSSICKPAQYYLFSRHGHRFLGASDLENAKEFADDFKGKYNKTSGAKWFANYSLPWPITDDEFLTKIGKADMEAMGKRDGKAWYDLSFDERNTKFYTSSVNRSYESAKAFIRGFSSILGKPSKDFSLVVDNITARFYDFCPLFQKIKHSNWTKAEARRFLKGPELVAVVKNIKRRLGIEAYTDSMLDKDPGVMEPLFYMCQAELAAGRKKPIWCYIFDDADSFPLEYWLDIKKYYIESYGSKNNIGPLMACPLVKNILRMMEAAVDGVKNNKPYDHGIFGFGHSGSLIPLFSAFGLFKPDEPLTASNYAQQAGRPYNIGRISPFSGNLAFVLYECPTGAALAKLSPADRAGLPAQMERFMVEVYSNEKSTKLQYCDKELCAYSKVKKVMKYYETCSLKKICKTRISASSIS